MFELEINFRPNGNSARFVRDGWSEPEPFGRWMVGRESILLLPATPKPAGGLELRALVGPFLHPGVITSQPVTISVNGCDVLTTDLVGVRELVCAVPGTALAIGEPIAIRFRHEGGRSPSSLSGAGDMRELSMSIWSLTVFGAESPETQQQAELVPTEHRRFGTDSFRAVFNVLSRGNLANRMIQYMVARSVQAQAKDCVITGVELDEWGLTTPAYGPDWADEVIVDEQYIDVKAVASLLDSGAAAKVSFRGYGQRMENFLPVDAYRDAFKSDIADMTWFDERFLVINVRSGELVDGQIRDYVLTPVDFYRDVIATSGLIPIFIGQLERNVYTDQLRAAFPHAVFLESRGPIRDFETVRRSKNIVPSVSTFSWLAAWLSHADRIYLPVNGLFNPLQFPPVDLIPLNDPRYVFYLFPINYAVAARDLDAAHRAIDGQWRRVSSATLAELMSCVAPT